MMGVMLGAIPGLNSTMGTALLIPFTYAMDATTGLTAAHGGLLRRNFRGLDLSHSVQCARFTGGFGYRF